MSSAAFLLHIHVGNCLDLLADSTWPLRLLDVYVNRVIPDTTPINEETRASRQAPISNFLQTLPNFGGLVLGCIEADSRK